MRNQRKATQPTRAKRQVGHDKLHAMALGERRSMALLQGYLVAFAGLFAWSIAIAPIPNTAPHFVGPLYSSSLLVYFPAHGRFSGFVPHPSALRLPELMLR